jgi:hypothetical protein
VILGLESERRGSRQRRISTFAASSALRERSHAGYSASPAAGSRAPLAAVRAAGSTPSSATPRVSPVASKRRAVLPLGLANPTALALALRSARSRSASICTALRRSSIAAKARRRRARSRAAPAAATPVKSLRSSLGSSTMIPLSKRRYCRRCAGPSRFGRARCTRFLPVARAARLERLADLDLEPARRGHIVAPVRHPSGK